MAEQKKGQDVDVNQLLKVRREKLQDLQERGKDPFQITKYDMTHHSMEIKDNFDELEGKTVGAFGVIGPTRMNYDNVSSVLDYIRNELNTNLTKLLMK